MIKLLIRSYHFLGGIIFAIFLIVTAAAFVMAGTILESKTGSHLYAASFTYHNPLFLSLLAGFFINILFSATRRWPFKKRHIPFLITHLGLLMILSGTMVKNIFGIQGHMNLVEGSASDHILIPNTHALYVETKEGAKTFILNELNNSTLQLVGFYPHSTESLKTWIKGDAAFMYGFAPFPLGEKIRTKLHPDYPEFDVLALRAPPGKTAEEVSKEYSPNSVPLLLLIEDENEDNVVMLIDKNRFWSESFKKGQLKSLIAYDKGYYGYGVELKLPVYSIEKALSRARDLELAPPLELLKKAAPSYDSFAATLTSFLEEEEKEGNIIYSGAFKLPELDFKLISPKEYKACCLIASLFPILEKKGREGVDIAEFLDRAGWPFAKSLQDKGNQLFDALLEQIYFLGDELPDLAPPSQNALFSAFLRLYSINTHQIMQELEPDFITLEAPLTAKRQKAPRLQKIEEEKPLVYLELNQKERIALTYDPSGKGLKWPTLKGDQLLRFQPETKKIPYRIRLQNARQITHQNSNQTFSFEADLIVQNQPVTISMNHVHETWDGYRFYLSNISPGTEGEVQWADIVVSHDPTKYILTYPGALILSLGIILIFWASHYFK